MALKIVKVSDDLYSVCATPPDVMEEWSPSEPVKGSHLTRALIEALPPNRRRRRHVPSRSQIGSGSFATHTSRH